MPRPDQLRDRDSIQRGIISTRIVGPVSIFVTNPPIGQPELYLSEPHMEGPPFRFEAKFRFEFKDNDTFREFVLTMDRALTKYLHAQKGCQPPCYWGGRMVTGFNSRCSLSYIRR